ncbi:MAG: hypothetical protein ACREX3_18635, partial [Gammaproteobacteria bacterium]
MIKRHRCKLRLTPKKRNKEIGVQASRRQPVPFFEANKEGEITIKSLVSRRAYSCPSVILVVLLGTFVEA